METQPTMIAISAETYEKAIQTIDELSARDREVFELKQDARKSALKLDTVAKHLDNFLDLFEARFSVEGKCDSPEHAIQYLDAAKYMRDNFGRKDYRYISLIQDWYNSEPIR